MAIFKGIQLPDGTTYFPEGSGSAIDTVSVSVDNNTGVPSATGNVSGTTLNLDFKNLKGETGSTGPQGDPGQGVPAGGAAGQVLKKKSGTDYDTEWADETGGSSTGGDGTAEKEWQLFQTITGDGETLSFEWNSLDFNEFIFICKGLTNASEIEGSLRIIINGVEISQISTQGSNSSSESKYQFAHFKYNGLCWQQQVMPQANNESGFYIILANVQAPYAYNLEVGKCNSLRIKSLLPQYALVSGTIKIYAR